MWRALLAWLLPFVALASDANLSWVAPTTRTDGSAYTNPGGYRLWERCGSDPLALLATVGPTETTYQRAGIPDDGRTCFWSLTAFDLAGIESVRTNEASKSFPLGLPGAATNLVITWSGSQWTPDVATPVFNAAGQTSSGVSASTLTLSSFSAAPGRNRFLEVWVGVGSVSPAEPTGVTWGGVAMTKRGTAQALSDFWYHVKYFIKEADFPSGATGNIVATWAGAHDERALCALVHSDVNQTNPYRNASQTAEDDGSSLTPSISVTSNADDVVTAGIWAVMTFSEITAIANTAGTERADTGPIGGGFEIASCSTVAGAASAVVTWSISRSGSSSLFATGMLADSLQGASGLGINNLTTGSSTTNGAATASISPTPGSAVYLTAVVTVPSTLASSAPTLTPSGVMATWDFVGATIYGDRRWLVVYRGSGTVTPGTITLTWSGSLNGGYQSHAWAIDQVTGHNSSDPDDAAVTGAGTNSLDLADVGTVDAGDAVYSVGGHEDGANNFALTGYTALGSIGALGNVRQIKTYYDDSAPDETPSWTSDGGGNAIGAVAFVINAAGGGAVASLPPGNSRRFYANMLLH